MNIGSGNDLCSCRLSCTPHRQLSTAETCPRRPANEQAMKQIDRHCDSCFKIQSQCFIHSKIILQYLMAMKIKKISNSEVPDSSKAKPMGNFAPRKKILFGTIGGLDKSGYFSQMKFECHPRNEHLAL